MSSVFFPFFKVLESKHLLSVLKAYDSGMPIWVYTIPLV